MAGTIFRRFGPFSLRAFHRKMHVWAVRLKRGNAEMLLPLGSGPSLQRRSFCGKPVCKILRSGKHAFSLRIIQKTLNVALFNHNLKGDERAIPQGKYVENDCRKVTPDAKLLPPEGFHTNIAPMLFHARTAPARVWRGAII